ncbi:hypothetical protein BH10BAC5_BH10BAC5_08320 [soil metagenome]
MTIRSSKIFFLILFIFSSAFILSGCTSGNYEDESERSKTNQEQNDNSDTNNENSSNSELFSTAKIEQQNEMYSPSHDSTYLYWLNNKLLVLGWTTKCNIFALNTLFKSGYKTPKVNTLCRDMFDTTRFNDIFPVVPLKLKNSIRSLQADTSDDHSEEIIELKLKYPEEIKRTLQPGDLVIWKGHVILFDKFIPSKKKLYVMAWWAGTSQQDNGDNVINNVIYGKYPIEGDFVIRRPQKK